MKSISIAGGILGLTLLVTACSPDSQTPTAASASGTTASVDPTRAVASLGDISHWVTKGPLRFEKLDHNFGRIVETETVTARFRVTPAGDRRVHISNIEKTCGCAIPKITTRDLAPGEFSEITVEFNPKGHPGSFHKSIILSTDRPEISRANMGIIALVEPRLAIHPRSIAFGRFQPKMASEWRPVDIASLNLDFDITAARIDGRHFEMEAIPEDQALPPIFASEFPRKRFSYRIRYSGQPEYGRQRAQAVFVTNDDQMPLITMHLLADIEAPVRIMPSVMSVILTPEAREWSQPLRLMNTKGEPLGETRPRIELPAALGLKARHIPGDPTTPHLDTWIIEGRIPGVKDWPEKDNFQGRIVFPTGRSDMGEAVLPVRVIARRAR